MFGQSPIAAILAAALATGLPPSPEQQEPKEPKVRHYCDHCGMETQDEPEQYNLYRAKIGVSAILSKDHDGVTVGAKNEDITETFEVIVSRNDREFAERVEPILNKEGYCIHTKGDASIILMAMQFVQRNMLLAGAGTPVAFGHNNSDEGGGIQKGDETEVFILFDPMTSNPFRGNKASAGSFSVCPACSTDCVIENDGHTLRCPNDECEFNKKAEAAADPAPLCPECGQQSEIDSANKFCCTNEECDEYYVARKRPDGSVIMTADDSIELVQADNGVGV